MTIAVEERKAQPVQHFDSPLFLNIYIMTKQFSAPRGFMCWVCSCEHQTQSLFMTTIFRDKFYFVILLVFE